MAAKVRRWIDPTSRDYIVENGGLREDDGFASKVALAWGTKLGSCIVCPWLGSRFHEIKTWDLIGAKLAEKYGLEAIAHLASEIDGLTVTATLSTVRGRIELVASGRRGTKELKANYTATVGI